MQISKPLKKLSECIKKDVINKIVAEKSTLFPLYPYVRQIGFLITFLA
jgi:hypothetical protein